MAVIGANRAEAERVDVDEKWRVFQQVVSKSGERFDELQFVEPLTTLHEDLLR